MLELKIGGKKLLPLLGPKEQEASSQAAKILPSPTARLVQSTL
jgi:hypothetical protein